MRRLLMLGLVAFGLFWWLTRLLSGAVAGRRRPAGRQPAARGDQRMVRDRVCNTFLPAARALTLRTAGEEHFFCSERCRERFLEGAAEPAPDLHSGASHG